MEDRKICNDKNARQTKKINRVMEKKALYIRLDSSPLPKKSDRIIVKDFNLENYFCALLGKRLLEDHTIIQSILYPGKIVSDFRSSSIKSYNAIIKQWELLLVKLLSGNNKEECFILKYRLLILNGCHIKKTKFTAKKVTNNIIVCLF